MITVVFRRALGLSVVAALATTALPYGAASAAPTLGRSLVATSHDGAAFELDAYAAGDITVQVTDAVTGQTDVDDSQDLAYSWQVTPFAVNTPAVRVPATGTDTQATDNNGEFVVPLPIDQGAGTYTLTAELGPDASSANAISSTVLLTVRTGQAAPAGSTAVLDALGTGTPGKALAGRLTVTAPDGTYGNADNHRDPVAGQVFSLTVDRGFFTTGQPSLPSVAGALAGDLDQRGTKLTGVTNAQGELAFSVGIARDGGFDDDGLVTATVNVASGPTAAQSAVWDTSKPLNGRVALALSPAGEQEAAVNPALAGDRTFYEVFAFDQFGNRVGGAPIDLTYSGNLDDYDYSDEFALSDFDLFGDIWLTSFEAGTINIIGTWEDAPTYRYADTVGNTVVGASNASDSIASSTYEGSFGASRFSIRSSATDVVRVGAAVTQTVQVVDQRGNPARGYEVRFFREGPDAVRSDAVATGTTNAQGQASYTFVGTKRGRAKITAEVTDGTSRRVLAGSAVFGATVTARLRKGKGGSGGDRLTVSARSEAAGAKVQMYRVVNGKQTLVGSKKLNIKGKVAFKIRDRNRKAYTTYVAVVRSTSRSVADQSNSVKIR